MTFFGVFRISFRVHLKFLLEFHWVVLSILFRVHLMTLLGFRSFSDFVGVSFYVSLFFCFIYGFISGFL